MTQLEQLLQVGVLTGSRAFNCSTTESDWDIVVLESDCARFMDGDIINSTDFNSWDDAITDYGKACYDLSEHPEFEDEQPTNPFDLWEGANFKLKIRNVEGYRNYDKSEFAASAPLMEDDEKMEAVWKKEYSLKEFVAESNFKTYDELKARLDKVLGVDGSAPAPRTTVEQARASAPRKPVQAEDSGAPVATDDDDDMAYFSKLAAE